MDYRRLDIRAQGRTFWVVFGSPDVGLLSPDRPTERPRFPARTRSPARRTHPSLEARDRQLADRRREALVASWLRTLANRRPL
jgi:hypothetical protein